MSTAQDSPLYALSDGAARHDVLLWLLTLAIHQDGLPRHRHHAPAL